MTAKDGVNAIASGMETILAEQLKHRVKKLDEMFGHLGGANVPDNVGDFCKQLDALDERLTLEQGMLYLPLFFGLKQEHADPVNPEALRGDDRGPLPQVTVETLMRNMRAWDIRDPRDKPCVQIPRGQPCIFTSLCAQNDHPLLGTKRTAPCGTSFKYEGEDVGDAFSVTDPPQRHCVFCILFHVNNELDTLQASKATVEHKATPFNPFTVIASPEVAGGNMSIFRHDHPLIHGHFPAFDAFLMPCYFLRSEQYRTVHPLTHSEADLQDDPDKVIGLVPPSWRISLERDSEGHDVSFGEVMRPAKVVMDCAISAGTEDDPELAIQLTTGTRNDLRTNVNRLGEVYKDVIHLGLDADKE